MAISKCSLFYINGRKMLENYVLAGGNIDDLSCKDKEYNYIRCFKIKDENGRLYTVDEKFKMLGFPRKTKITKNLRESLIKEIEMFKADGNTFHMERKKMPFERKLQAYSNSLKRKGIYMTHEQIMKEDLGYPEYSDLYYRALKFQDIGSFADVDGYVDSYRKDKDFNLYLLDLGYALNIPYYLLITLVADYKLKECDICLDKIAYTKRMLENYALQYGSFVGLRTNDRKTFNALDYLVRYYSDGMPEKFSKAEWLNIFGLGGYKNIFRDVKQESAPIDDIMLKLQNKFGASELRSRDLTADEYAAILEKAVSLNVNVSDIFKMYNLNYKGNVKERFSHATLNEIPYFEEMKQMRDALLTKSRKTLENGFSKEEVFEARVRAVQQVYECYKQKIETYVPDLYMSNKKEEIIVQ